MQSPRGVPRRTRVDQVLAKQAKQYIMSVRYSLKLEGCIACLLPPCCFHVVVVAPAELISSAAPRG